MQQQQQTEFVCPNCSGGYNEPMEVMNRDGIDHHECPHCRNTMDVQFTEGKNIEQCHNHTFCDQAESELGYESCSKCGVIMSVNHTQLGVKSTWNPAEGRL